MMKTFRHVINEDIPQLPTTYINNKRFYCLPSGEKLPSVTTVLDHFKSKDLAEWRARVGEDRANRIARKAAAKGSALHAVVEKYLLNDPDPLEGAMPNTRQQFFGIRDTLNRINNIHRIECTLHSSKLGVAGRTDVIAEFDYDLSIIDLKTSRRQKKEEWITSYFEQGTAYAVMYEEMFGVPIDKVVIIMISEERFPQVFVKNKNDYIKPLKEKIEIFRKENQACF